MSKNPFLNAVAASVYISIVSSFMFYGSRFFPKKDTLLAPIAMISLFTLSAAVMGYLFLYQPFMLFLDGNKKKAVDFFLRTVAVFSVITVLAFALLLI
ncbi:MAG: hypothetical protein BWY24_00333 [Microgenomates group bacterium ADurb.Bin219]|nr:MAG: hypothetical protein BWY24_00333 [Microgenomates group bacterium ADurb.Bin219]